MKSYPKSFLYIFILLLCLDSHSAFSAVPGNPHGFKEKTNEPVAVETTTSLTQYGITWTFSSQVQYGQFVNGDYYVIAPEAGITISSVSPAPASGRNGSMINPTAGSKHPFDDRVRGGYDSSKGITYPVSLHAGDSLISTISRNETDTTDFAGAAIDSKVKIKTAAVLTILPSPPPAGSFRPAYCDTKTTLYNIDQVRTDILPQLPPTSTLPSHPPFKVLEYYSRGLKRPWIIFARNWLGRDIHPYNNMKGYHRNIGEFLSEATMLLMTNLPMKDDLIINYIQVGIDYYHMAIQGEGDSAFWAAPIIITGLLLNNPDIYNSFKDERIKSVSRDFPDFYYWPDHKSTLSSDIVEKGKTWTGATVFYRNQIGAGEHEHLDPSEWNDAYSHQKNENYRICCDSHPHVGMVLAAMILESRGFKMKEKWHHNATFDYIDRWMTEPESDRTSHSAFIDDMWKKYRNLLH